MSWPVCWRWLHFLQGQFKVPGRSSGRVSALVEWHFYEEQAKRVDHSWRAIWGFFKSVNSIYEVGAVYSIKGPKEEDEDQIGAFCFVLLICPPSTHFLCKCRLGWSFKQKVSWDGAGAWSQTPPPPEGRPCSHNTDSTFPLPAATSCR